MQTALKYISREEYFTLEESAKEKHEFYQGEIFAMAGGSFNHSAIGVNIITSLKTKLRGKSCQPTNSDMRVETPDSLITYPDATIFCGEPELSENQCSLLNPIVIIEVLSPSTRAYDQGNKFLLYRSIPSFRDYLLIDSEKFHIQHFRKVDNNEWILHDYFSVSDKIYFNSIQESISMAEIYEGIVF
jgi:Uma2 family endonuclease